MPEDIEKVIYKLELDSTGYINGVESLSNSTKKLTAEQEKANAVLKESEAILKNQSADLQKRKQDLEAFTSLMAKANTTTKAANEKTGQALQKSLQTAQAENQKLTEIVNKNRIAYDAAAKAAADFAEASRRATNLQPVPGQGKIPTGPGVPSGITSQIAGVLNLAEFDKQTLVIEKTKKEFDDLRVSIGRAEERMKQLNAEDEEFKLLAPIVEQGKEALRQYDAAAKGAGEATGSLRAQIRQGKEELVKLEQAGKGATTQYFELEKRVARLTDEFGDQQERIKVLASDTRALDFGKAAITTATSAFQAYTAVSILAGDESEELQKKTMQLFAAMQLLTSLEQLQNSVKRGSVIATNLQAASQAVYTAVVGASTGALKAFKLALIGTGIGAAIVLIGFLVSKWLELKAAQEKAAITQKALLEINTKAVASYADEVTHLKLLSAEYTNVNTSAKRKKDIQDELQKSYPNYFKDLDKHADKEKYIAEQIDKVSQAIILQAKIQGAQALLSQKFQALLEKQFDPKLATDFGDKLISSFKHLTDAGAKADLAKTAKSNIKDAESEYDDFAKFISDFVNKSNAELEALGGDPKKQETKTATKVKEIENVFLQKKAALDQQLAELTRKEADDESKIKIEFAARLAREQQEIAKLLKDKKLTKDQADILDKETIQINNIGLENALKEFHKKQLDARKKLLDELHDLQDRAAQDTINLLQNEFDRRRELIRFNEEKEIVDTIFANQRRLADFEESSKLIYGKDFQTNKDFLDKKALLIAAGEQKIIGITLKAEQERADLSADIFQNLLGFYTSAIAAADLVFTQDEANAIRALADKFLEGKISYEKFQKELTKIEKDAAKLRQKNTLQIETDRLVALDNELKKIEDKYSDHYKKLEKQRNEQAQKVAELQIANAKSDVTDPATTTAIDQVAKYAEAIGAVADSVIKFWQAANDAEREALDRSIALQETRVQAAQRIADRGNAQYLKAEEDRLTELNVKRENAARKQLGIDAALQASQILVGITGAISRIAGAPFGAETIADIAIIIGALATGYGLVKSLQGNVPKLRGGTKYLERNGQPSGIDTIPFMGNEGEAVIPTDRNKAYHPTIKAVYDGTIPADQLNKFVTNYHRIKSVPQPDYFRIKQAAELHIGSNGKMHLAITEQNKLIIENNELQRQTLRAMKNMAVSANIDKNGVAIMVNEFIEQMKIDSRI